MVDELLAVEPDVVPHAVPLVSNLISVDSCRDEQSLELSGPPPSEDREEIQATRGQITRANNLRRIGHYDRGLDLAREATSRAETLNWPPLLAEARLHLGLLLLDTSGPAGADIPSS